MQPYLSMRVRPSIATLFNGKPRHVVDNDAVAIFTTDYAGLANAA
jgi:hypothetical protein